MAAVELCNLEPQSPIDELCWGDAKVNLHLTQAEIGRLGQVASELRFGVSVLGLAYEHVARDSDPQSQNASSFSVSSTFWLLIIITPRWLQASFNQNSTRMEVL